MNRANVILRICIFC